jgi:heptosyltransferase-3
MGMSKQGLVLHQGAIGDFVLSLAIVQALRKAIPVNQVIAIASAPSARLAAGRSAIDEQIAPEVAKIHSLFGEGPVNQTLKDMLTNAAWILSFLGNQQGQPSRRLREITPRRFVCIDPRPRTQTLQQRRHITDQWADDIREQGINIPRPIAPRIRISEPVATSTRSLIHPGSGGREKCWPFERFLELADALQPPIGWLLGPAEAERQPDWVQRLQTRASNRHEQLFIEEDVVAAALDIVSSRAYIGNDSGMTHVAAALGVPTVAIFGPTDPQVWQPLNLNAHVVSPAEPASIDVMPVELVFAKIREFSGRATPKT